MQDFYRTFGLVNSRHLDEPVALRLVGVAIVDDFDVAHGAHALEEFLQFILGCVVGEVAEVETGGIDRPRSGSVLPAILGRGDAGPGLGRLAGAFFGGPGFGSAFSLTGRTNRFFVEAEGLEDFLPPGQRNRFWLAPGPAAT